MELALQPGTAKKPRILIAEDNPVNMLVLRLMLSGAGYAALEAGNGAAAVEVALQERPDLIFMDMMMPGMNGISAAREILSSGGPAPRIVAVTGNSNDEVQQECEELGFDGILMKPVDKAAIVSTIERLFPPTTAEDAR